MIEEYLDLTNQQDEVSMLVSGLLSGRKAIIGSAVSIYMITRPILV